MVEAYDFVLEHRDIMFDDGWMVLSHVMIIKLIIFLNLFIMNDIDKK